jgi:DNA-cytosine methyltransferase
MDKSTRYSEKPSLFDGMSCGQLALNRAGVKYGRYFASEIDKHAIAVTQQNFPRTVQLGDVTKVNVDRLPQISLLMGGSPCQGFSTAGQGLNFEDPRSKLFFEFVRLMRELKPRYFLLENVNMKQDWQDVISGFLGVKPILINSSDFSAQNRLRLYWTNFPVHEWIDKKLTIRDIIEGNVKDISRHKVEKNDEFFGGSKGKLSRERLSINLRDLDEKSACLGAWNAGNPCGSGGTAVITQKNGVTTWRAMTPLECERLQTVPENYTGFAPKSQRYKMLGNGWTVEVIAHLFKQIALDQSVRQAA